MGGNEKKVDCFALFGMFSSNGNWPNSGLTYAPDPGFGRILGCLTGFGFGRTLEFFSQNPNPMLALRATLVDIMTPPLITGRFFRRWTVQCSRL